MWDHMSDAQVPVRVQNERIIELLEQIVVELKAAKRADRLWSLNDIAAYLNRSKNTVQQRVVCKVDFPDAIRIPTSAGALGPLWYASQVKAYIKKHQKK